MLDKHPVVMFSFVGRQRYLEPMLWHSLKCRPFVDKHALCLHTGNKRDLEYIHGMIAKYPDYFYAVDIGYTAGPPRYSQFFDHFTTVDTYYVKLDDDIVWMQEGAIEALVRYKKANPHLLMAFANTVNNGLCNHIHQRMGAAVSPIKMEWNAYFVSHGSDAPRIRHSADVHQSLLSHIAFGTVSKYTGFDEWWLWERNIRVSINCLCMVGQDIQGILPVFYEDRRRRNVLSADDESLMTEVLPGVTGRDNAICGRALVAHYAFGVQHEYLVNHTDTLNQYRALAGFGDWRSVAN